MKTFCLKSFIKDISKNEFVKMCEIPMGYKVAYPLFDEKNDRVLLTVPFYRVKNCKLKKNGVTGVLPEVKGVLPIEYAVKFELHKASDASETMKKLVKNPEGHIIAKPIGFETLKYCDKFNGIPFGKVVSTFPSPAIKSIGKEEYKNKIDKLYEAYDIIINDLLGISKASGIDKLEFKQLISFFVEPNLKESYKLLSESFVAKYFQD